MERESTQSMLDEKFPHGANIAQVGLSGAFNIPRFIVYDGGRVVCVALEEPRELVFYPESFEDGPDEGSLIFKNATVPHKRDLIARQPTPAVLDTLMKWRAGILTGNDPVGGS